MVIFLIFPNFDVQYLVEWGAYSDLSVDGGALIREKKVVKLSAP